MDKNNHSKDVFVRNRAKEILDTEIEIKHVGTADNPADFVTRCLTVKQFGMKSDFWKSGPIWLLDCEQVPNKTEVKFNRLL